MTNLSSSVAGAVATLGLLLTSVATAATDLHPSMDSKYWAHFGAFFAARDFDVSASGTVGQINLHTNFERSVGLDDRPDLFSSEFGWQFSEKWGLSLQHFSSARAQNAVLEDTIEWQDVSYDVGVDVTARTKVKVTRVFFSRHVWGTENQNLRLGTGIHYIEAGATIAGEATLADMSREFRRSAVSTSIPIPNIGAWYRYSPAERWIFHARMDWFSAKIGEYSGGIWNVAAGANYRVTPNFGVGLNYQFFEIDGTVRKLAWTGDLRTRFGGPLLHLSAYW